MIDAEIIEASSLPAPPLIKKLLSVDSRLRLYPFMDTIQRNVSYLPRKNFIYLNYDIPSLEHEIAHMVEINDPGRCVITDWGQPIFSNISKVPAKPLLAALSREIRVRAIQIHLEEPDKVKYVENILDDENWAIAIQHHLTTGFGKFKSLAEVQDWANYLRDKTYRDWNSDRIVSEWENKFTYIKNWMETPSNNK